MKTDVNSELDIFCIITNRLKKNGLIYSDNPQNEDNIVIKLDKVIKAALLVDKNMHFRIHTVNDETIYEWTGDIHVSKKLLKSRVKFILKNYDFLEIYVDEEVEV